MKSKIDGDIITMTIGGKLAEEKIWQKKKYDGLKVRLKW
jgi:hypothetical protein